MRHSGGLLPFQECTASWVLRQFRDKDRKPRRFLVADEVGLGKTKVAARIIEALWADQGRLAVVYVSSSLDISQQNRKKLCPDPDKQVVHADRICLLYAEGYKKTGLRIISLTPSTSLNLKRGAGNIKERAYIARYLALRFHVPRQLLVTRLKGQANVGSFEAALDDTRRKARLPPERVCAAIDRAWERGGLIGRLRSSDTKTAEVGRLIANLRGEMAKAILRSLKPDLVILDEAQKFPDVINVDENAELLHPVAKELLGNEVPTLLLSATPYRAFVGASQIVPGSTHVDELRRILGFLTGSASQAKKLATDIANYAIAVREIAPDRLDDVLVSKKNLEAALMQYMTRAERINFEESSTGSYIEKILPPERFPISARHLAEWVKLKDFVPSKRAFLHLWRSGNSPLSYMTEYKLFEALYNGKYKTLLKDSSLYTNLGSHAVHSKLEYLKTDLLAGGDIAKYLWIPPTRPYYRGSGIYAPDILQTVIVKKGLVFSSWSFVPRFVAAELSAWQSKRHKQKPVQHPLKDNVRNWARFWHPSPWLASLVTHVDFCAGDQEFADLAKLAQKKIAEHLKGAGWRIGKTSARVWEVLCTMDLKNRHAWSDGIRQHFKKTRNEFTRRSAERGGAMPEDQVSKLIDCSPELVVSAKTIKELAMIALTSPAVCLLRTLYSVGVLSSSQAEDHHMAILSDFCARNWKMFFNREGTARAVMISYSARKSFAEKLQSYFADGNIQAVLDEYIFHVQPGAGSHRYREILHKLADVFGPKGGQLRVPVKKDRRGRVTAEQITLFGKVDEMTQSRSSVREAFNSPFWPFVLVSTSVGQEGLDFHLYCKDIYHWNLPSNPVDFEQREGRINRFNSLWVRSVIARTVKFQNGRIAGFYWDRLYNEAPKYAHRNDRFNLGMSPHWTYTPSKEGGSRGYVRHILAMPGTEERLRYESLIKDLTLYRLTLGQPNQAEFLEGVKKNEYLKSMDSRAITLCLFPYDQDFIQSRIYRDHEKEERWHLLIEDSLSLLRTLRRSTKYKALSAHVKRHIKIIRTANSHKQITDSIRALLYFVNPHDRIPDRTPGIGWDDDLERMKNANPRYPRRGAIGHKRGAAQGRPNV